MCYSTWGIVKECLLGLCYLIFIYFAFTVIHRSQTVVRDEEVVSSGGAPTPAGTSMYHVIDIGRYKLANYTQCKHKYTGGEGRRQAQSIT